MEKYLTLKNLSSNNRYQALESVQLRRLLDAFRLPPDSGPHIADFQPLQGYAGSVVTIIGSNFSGIRENNRVYIGGRNAYVVEATADRLLVITHQNTITGQVEVEIDGKTATGPRPFEILPWPKPQSGEDGPPYSYAGRRHGSARLV